jgi:hypothetical protein
MARGYKWCCSTAVNYDPKYHLRFMLDPLDLYVRHTSSLLNLALKLFHPLAAPTRSHPTLRQFANYADLWGDAGEAVTSETLVPDAADVSPDEAPLAPHLPRGKKGARSFNASS